MENVYAVEDVIRFTQNGVERVGIIEEVGA